MDRRRLLQSVPSFLFASSIPALWTPAQAAKAAFPAALLVPKSGPHAALGRSMERAAVMAQGETDARALRIYDTGGTAEGAAVAARAARKGGAAVIVGPLLAAEVPAVIGVAGATIPVIAFSNDAALLDRGAFLLGITARQVTAGILAYAAQRGIRRVAVAGPADAWTAQVRAAAQAAAGPLDLELHILPEGQFDSLSGDFEGLPDAVLVSSVAGLSALAAPAQAQGVQLLGATPNLDLGPAALSRLDGAWLAGPDPARFADFARAFENRTGTAPGAITALAFDAINIVKQARLGGGVDRSALLVASGFKAVCGDIRFREDGSAARAIAILAAADGGLRTVAAGAMS